MSCREVLAASVAAAERGGARRGRWAGAAGSKLRVRIGVAAPRPIPGGFDKSFNAVPSGAFVHVLPPSVGSEMSTITDFNGVVGASETQGTAHGSDGTAYSFDCDMRFMRGVYVGLDGRLHNASFGFI